MVLTYMPWNMSDPRDGSEANKTSRVKILLRV